MGSRRGVGESRGGRGAVGEGKSRRGSKSIGGCGNTAAKSNRQRPGVGADQQVALVVVIVIGETVSQAVEIDRMPEGRVIIAGGGLIKGRGIIEIGGVVQNVAVNTRGHHHFDRQFGGIATGEDARSGQRVLRGGIADIIRAARTGKSHLAARACGGAVVGVAPGADD